LPVELIFRIRVKALREKYSTSVFQKYMVVCLHPAPPEGRIAIVTDVGFGMRWTCWRRQTSDADADGEDVWS
jgi:hypothetical protein